MSSFALSHPVSRGYHRPADLYRVFEMAPDIVRVVAQKTANVISEFMGADIYARDKYAESPLRKINHAPPDKPPPTRTPQKTPRMPDPKITQRRTVNMLAKAFSAAGSLMFGSAPSAPRVTVMFAHRKKKGDDLDLA